MVDTPTHPQIFQVMVLASIMMTAMSLTTLTAQTHENGIGPDPDRDTNPATITGTIKRIDAATQASRDAPYRVINFEPPPGQHGDKIRNTYASDYGVHFSAGVTRQICEGQRRFYYDSMCTYEAAPSGDFSIGYVNALNAPLVIEFDEPVCVITMAIFPTGGKEGETFTVSIEGWDSADLKLAPAQTSFDWTHNTVRWRHMAGAYYIGQRAKKVAISMKSNDPKEKGDVLRYLIDDLAFVQKGCADVLSDLTEGDAT